MRRDGRESYLFSMTFGLFCSLAYFTTLTRACQYFIAGLGSLTNSHKQLYVFLRRGFSKLFSFFLIRKRGRKFIFVESTSSSKSMAPIVLQCKLPIIFFNIESHLSVFAFCIIHKNGVGKLFDNFHFVEEAQGRSWALELVISSSHKK